MEVEQTAIPEVLLIKPKLFGDERGFFQETFQAERYAEYGIGPLLQDNLSKSSRGVLRGLHYQLPDPQGKLVYVIEGEVLDIAVDIRLGSPSFGQWVGARLSGDNHHQLWVPEGFAHGFCVLSDYAIFAYKCSAYYKPEAEISLRWDDPTFAIDWPIAEPSLSIRDAAALNFDDIPKNKLPHYIAPA
ncbi:MAG: dTDP-4-dehydrorhamnose 3,5-epimerase [Pseudomonadales bacterium]